MKTFSNWCAKNIAPHKKIIGQNVKDAYAVGVRDFSDANRRLPYSLEHH